MRQLFMLFMLLQTAVIYAGTPAQLTITLASEQSTYLLGEPVILECSLENKGEAPLVVVCNLSFPFTPCALHINGPIRKNCVEPRGQYEIGAYTTPPPLMAHEIRRLPPITASVLGVVCAGDYEFWIEYDATTLGAAPLRARLTPIRAESNHVHVRLVRPTGIDAKIFTKHANACNQLNLKSNVLLEKYPTSTYAGYVLARKIPDYSNPLFHPVPPAKQLMMAREEGKTYVAFPDKSFEQYFQQLDRFMKGGHIPESLRTVLWSFYGDQLVRRGRFTEAEEAFQRATQGTPPTGGKALAYYERAKGFLEAFEAKKQPAQEP